MLSKTFSFLKQFSFQQKCLCIIQVMFAWNNDLLQSRQLLVLNFLMKSLVEIINLVVYFALTDKLTKIILDCIKRVMEFLCNLFYWNNFVSLHMLLKSFQSDVSENWHFLMLSEEYIILQLILYWHQAFLEL